MQSSENRRLKPRTKETDMSRIATALVVLSILAGVAGQASAADMSNSKSYEQPQGAIR
jgi:hypothetical protein